MSCTYKLGSAASPKAALLPLMPTETPHIRLPQKVPTSVSFPKVELSRNIQKPTVTPDQNNAYLMSIFSIVFAIRIKHAVVRPEVWKIARLCLVSPMHVIRPIKIDVRPEGSERGRTQYLRRFHG